MEPIEELILKKLREDLEDQLVNSDDEDEKDGLQYMIELSDDELLQWIWGVIKYKIGSTPPEAKRFLVKELMPQSLVDEQYGVPGASFETHEERQYVFKRVYELLRAKFPGVIPSVVLPPSECTHCRGIEEAGCGHTQDQHFGPCNAFFGLIDFS